MWLNKIFTLRKQLDDEPQQALNLTLNEGPKTKQQYQTVQQASSTFYNGKLKEDKAEDQVQLVQDDKVFDCEEQNQNSSSQTLPYSKNTQSTTIRKNMSLKVESYINHVQNQFSQRNSEQPKPNNSQRSNQRQQLLERQKIKLKRLQIAQKSKAALQNNSIAFSYSAGGYLFPYYVGLTFELDNLNILKKGTPLCGASAGSLITVCYNSGMDKTQTLEALGDLTKSLRKVGSYRHLSEELYKILQNYLPQDAHTRCSGNTYLAVTRVKPSYQPMIISQYESREDLINTLITSCHIPMWSDRNYFIPYRDGMYMDGGFANFLPTPQIEGIQHTVRISCYPLQQFNKKQEFTEISPDLYARIPLSIGQITRMSFNPGTDDEIDQLVNMGKENAQMWVKLLDLDQAAQIDNDTLVENNAMNGENSEKVCDSIASIEMKQTKEQHIAE